MTGPGAGGGRPINRVHAMQEQRCVALSAIVDPKSPGRPAGSTQALAESLSAGAMMEPHRAHKAHAGQLRPA